VIQSWASLITNGVGGRKQSAAGQQPETAKQKPHKQQPEVKNEKTEQLTGN
jgi:hypothetical protein